jgi:hypothetical protein
MLKRTKRYLLPVLLCLVTTAMPDSANAQDESYTLKQNSLTQTLLNDKIEYYRHLYPEISFLILQGGDDTVTDMLALALLLGFKPKSLDYEHPQKLREDLMMVSANRILLMLQSKMPSASLFMADDPLVSRAHICVLTINPDEIASDSIQATRHLSSLPEKFIQKVPEDLQLQSGDYLMFVIDHEVYHCLQSMYVGPQRMSQKELWGEYNGFLDEQGADAYALGMNINTRHETQSFAENIQRIRGLALYSGDPGHLTYKALQQIVKIPVEDLARMSANEIFDTANHIKERLTISYDEFIQYLASSFHAMKDLGVEAHVPEKLRNKVKGTQADPALVKELVANSRLSLAEMGGEEVEP